MRRGRRRARPGPGPLELTWSRQGLEYRPGRLNARKISAWTRDGDGPRPPGTPLVGARESGVLAGLPASLPELLMALRLQERAAAVGFDWPDAAGPAAKVREELAEVEAELLGPGTPPTTRLDHEIGDLLFSVVN